MACRLFGTKPLSDTKKWVWKCRLRNYKLSQWYNYGLLWFLFYFFYFFYTKMTFEWANKQFVTTVHDLLPSWWWRHNRLPGGLYEMRYLWREHRPLTRYVELRVAHAPGMPGTFSLPPWDSDPDMHHDTCIRHLPWCIPGSLISGFLLNGWRENFPSIPGACATRNITYPVRCPCSIWIMILVIDLVLSDIHDRSIVPESKIWFTQASNDFSS